MEKGIRKILCWALCLVMAVMLLPVTEASADGSDAGLYAQINTDDFYGRNALKGLNNSGALLYAYDQLFEGIESANPTITVYDGDACISIDELAVVMDAVLRDMMGDFWYDGS